VASTNQVSLDDSPTFEALSYTWKLDDGSWSDGASVGEHFMIICDGQSLQVGANLFAALNNLRPSSPSGAADFWIDAICINQSDNTQRSQQVQIMQKIYAQAKAVIIWLGECQPSDAMVIEAFEKLEKYLDSLGDAKYRSTTFEGIDLSRRNGNQYGLFFKSDSLLGFGLSKKL
jgi:hypothetical protein